MRVFLILTLALLAGCSSTGGSGYGSHPSSSSASTHGRAPARTAVGVEVVFTEEEVRIIRAYYETHGESAGYGRGNGKGKGNKKAGGLPPGIAKNLARGKPLPPGLASSTLPYDLQRQLPPVPNGYERIVVPGKILLIEVATQVVRDVLTDAMFS